LYLVVGCGEMVTASKYLTETVVPHEMITWHRQKDKVRRNGSAVLRLRLVHQLSVTYYLIVKRVRRPDPTADTAVISASQRITLLYMKAIIVDCQDA
jgi:hypothetical protein